MKKTRSFLWQITHLRRRCRGQELVNYMVLTWVEPRLKPCVPWRVSVGSTWRGHSCLIESSLFRRPPVKEDSVSFEMISKKEVSQLDRIFTHQLVGVRAQLFLLVHRVARGLHGAEAYFLTHAPFADHVASYWSCLFQVWWGAWNKYKSFKNFI